MPTSVTHIIGAVITALIILGGLYAILRNFAIFLVDGLRGHPGKAWYNRPYLFRAIAVTATLFWLFGPFYGANDVLHLSADQQHITLFALYIVAAATSLWVLRIGFLDRIPQSMLHLRTNRRGFISWGTLAIVSYLIQLACAVAVGLLFAFAPGGSQSLGVRALVLVFLLASAFTSLWRMSYLAGPDNHTLTQQMEHVLGGRDAGPLHTHTTTDAPAPPPAAAVTEPTPTEAQP